MKKTEIAQLFLIIHNAYPNFSVDETKAAMWQEFLGDYPFEAAKANLMAHIRRSPYIPTVAEIAKPLEEANHERVIAETQLLLAESDERRARITPPPWTLKGGTE